MKNFQQANIIKFQDGVKINIWSTFAVCTDWERAIKDKSKNKPLANCFNKIMKLSLNTSSKDKPSVLLSFMRTLHLPHLYTIGQFSPRLRHHEGLYEGRRTSASWETTTLGIFTMVIKQVDKFTFARCKLSQSSDSQSGWQSLAIFKDCWSEISNRWGEEWAVWEPTIHWWELWVILRAAGLDRWGSPRPLPPPRPATPYMGIALYLTLLPPKSTRRFNEMQFREEGLDFVPSLAKNVHRKDYFVGLWQ